LPCSAKNLASFSTPVEKQSVAQLPLIKLKSCQIKRQLKPKAVKQKIPAADGQKP
jgi:hypothetical protein